jgi:hypothetical protein
MEHLVMSFLQRQVTTDVSAVIAALVVVLLHVQAAFYQFYRCNAFEFLLLESIAAYACTTEKANIRQPLSQWENLRFLVIQQLA